MQDAATLIVFHLWKPLHLTIDPVINITDITDLIYKKLQNKTILKVCTQYPYPNNINHGLNAVRFTQIA